jgi:hypothetical protein
LFVMRYIVCIGSPLGGKKEIVFPYTNTPV